ASPIVLSCMIRPPEHGVLPEAFIRCAADTLLRYCQMAESWSREAPTASSPVCTAANCTIHTREPGASPAASIQTASSSRRHYSQTALFWWLEAKAISVLLAVAAFPPSPTVPSYTIPPPERGATPATSATVAITQRRCCPMV